MSKSKTYKNSKTKQVRSCSNMSYMQEYNGKSYLRSKEQKEQTYIRSYLTKKINYDRK